jgi:hypothetical protein
MEVDTQQLQFELQSIVSVQQFFNAYCDLRIKHLNDEISKRFYPPLPFPGPYRSPGVQEVSAYHVENPGHWAELPPPTEEPATTETQSVELNSRKKLKLRTDATSKRTSST